jgi:DNA-binding NarL/FixJ family response regulator
MKDTVANALLECLRTVSAGNRCVPLELIAREQHWLTQAASIQQVLTSREREVMFLIAKGLCNKEVARQLQLSEGTVKLHLHRIYCKTGVNTKPALVALALSIGAAWKGPHG